jgi:hypothetical protein
LTGPPPCPTIRIRALRLEASPAARPVAPTLPVTPFLILGLDAGDVPTSSGTSSPSVRAPELAGSWVLYAGNTARYTLVFGDGWFEQRAGNGGTAGAMTTCVVDDSRAPRWMTVNQTCVIPHPRGHADHLHRKPGPSAQGVQVWDPQRRVVLAPSEAGPPTLTPCPFSSTCALLN